MGSVRGYRYCTLQWLRDEFLKHLDDWEKSVEARPEFSKEEKKRMLLSSETRLGLRMTSKVLKLCTVSL